MTSSYHWNKITAALSSQESNTVEIRFHTFRATVHTALLSEMKKLPPPILGRIWLDGVCPAHVGVEDVRSLFTRLYCEDFGEGVLTEESAERIQSLADALGFERARRECAQYAESRRSSVSPSPRAVLQTSPFLCTRPIHVPLPYAPSYVAPSSLGRELMSPTWTDAAGVLPYHNVEELVGHWRDVLTWDGDDRRGPLVDHLMARMHLHDKHGYTDINVKVIQTLFAHPEKLWCHVDTKPVPRRAGDPSVSVRLTSAFCALFVCGLRYGATCSLCMMFLVTLLERPQLYTCKAERSNNLCKISQCFAELLCAIPKHISLQNGVDIVRLMSVMFSAELEGHSGGIQCHHAAMDHRIAQAFLQMHSAVWFEVWALWPPSIPALSQRHVFGPSARKALGQCYVRILTDWADTIQRLPVGRNPHEFLQAAEYVPEVRSHSVEIEAALIHGLSSTSHQVTLRGAIDRNTDP